jgi:hypothetical protein
VALTTHERGCIDAEHPPAYDTESALTRAWSTAMEAARLMRDEDTGNIPVVDGELVDTVRAESIAVDGQQNLDEGLRLMVAKVVEVISK